MVEQTNHKHEGYIILMRRIFDNPLWTEKRRFSRFEAWIDLLRMAHYGDKPITIIDRGEKIKIKKGEILTSIKTLSEKWQRSQVWVRALLKHLESKNVICVNIFKNRRTIILINKYDYFQNLVKKSGTVSRTEREQNENRTRHKNKDNKDKKDNIIYIEPAKKQKKPFSSIKDITPAVIAEIAGRYNVPLEFVQLQYEKMVNWCEAKGKRYKNYKRALQNWVLRSLENYAQRRPHVKREAVDYSDIA